jgi:allantoinase
VSERLAVRSSRVLVEGEVQPATVVIEGGLIADVTTDSPPTALDDLGDLVLMPGLIDTHVHVNEPGRTEWEGFATATAAAAAGGVSAIIDMPLNSIPPTTTPSALEAKRAAADGKCAVDVGFWGGIVPGNLSEVAPLADRGVFGYKAFLVDSGVPEFPSIDLGDLEASLEAAAGVGLPLLVHAEAPGPIAAAPAAGDDYASYLASRPAAAEVEAIEALIGALRRAGGRAHVLHLSAADALPMIAAARAEGLAITVETCPHYLCLTAEEIDDDAYVFKCAPPIRETANRELLWQGVLDGTVDMIVSDHSPCPGDLKQGGFAAAWGGIASLELRLPAVWTEARSRGADLAQLAEWLCAAPARLAGIDSGVIEPGKRADLVAWDPDATFVVDAAGLHQRHKASPYDGAKLSGIVHRTYVRGVRAGARPVGRLLERS